MTDICIVRIELREIERDDEPYHDLHEEMRRNGFRRIVEHGAGFRWLPDATYYRLGSVSAETVHALALTAARVVHHGPAGVVTAPSLLEDVQGDGLETAGRGDFDEDARAPSGAPSRGRSGRVRDPDVDDLAERLTSTLEHAMPQEFRDASAAQKACVRRLARSILAERARKAGNDARVEEDVAPPPGVQP